MWFYLEIFADVITYASQDETIWVGSKSNDKCPFKGNTKKRRHCDTGSRDWLHVAANQEMTGATRS